MSQLNSFTCRRLNQLPKLPSVWEGDRRGLAANMILNLDEGEDNLQGDCILWVDGTQGMVRAISVVPSETGHEAVVRTLLQAMEHPQNPADPARPQKIVVRDREIQFFLRGALQNLDIVIDYVPDLPLIDDIFEGLTQRGEQRHPQLPESYANALIDKALEIWGDGPWNILSEQQIIAIELNRWDVETLYVSILGMAGVEYGLLMYRSLDSLKQFRQRVLGADQSPKTLQQAFLEQDCLFLNFELIEDDLEDTYNNPLYARLSSDLGSDLAWMDSEPDEIRPEFGSLHPLEGLRTDLAEEEAATLFMALEALHRFFQKYVDKLEDSPLPKLEGRYRIPNLDSQDATALIPVKVTTLPDVAKELIQQTETAISSPLAARGPFPILRDDYVPEGSIIILRLMSQEWVEYLKHTPSVYCDQSLGILSETLDGLPVVLIQTSRPKAQELIHNLRQAQGVKAVCFNSGADPLTGEEYDLGLLQTGDNEFHLFGEYRIGDRADERSLQHWTQWRKKYKGHCGVVIAGGVTGAAKGKPRLKDLFAFFETQTQPPEELGLPPLKLQFAVDWELE
ncbi:MAG: hypothetical protein QNJ46_31680 [Leptolyngbyaceae cyanobacterium MO_188.B28]|nr:hypothetical protein [Leptolyngbyaceae cyanobacterium MO_188.B28]